MLSKSCFVTLVYINHTTITIGYSVELNILLWFHYISPRAKTWRKHLEANADPRCVSVVTGNKSDIEEQEVSPEEGAEYAQKVQNSRADSGAGQGGVGCGKWWQVLEWEEKGRF